MKKLLISLAPLLITTCLFADNVTLAWDPSPTPTVIATKVYWGVTSRTYTNSITVPAPATMATITNLVAGTRYYFAATFSDGELESVYSEEVTYKFKPAPPQNLHIMP